MGGIGKSVRGLVIWAFFTAIGLTIIMAKLYHIKVNYTELHNKVNTLEREVKSCQKN